MRELRTEVGPGSFIGLEMLADGREPGEADTTGLTNHVTVTFLIKNLPCSCCQNVGNLRRLNWNFHKI